MSLSPLQLQELQDISIVLAEEFPSNVDEIWDTAMRFQLAGIGPLGVGGLPVFEAAVADLKITQEQLQTVQGRNAGASSGYNEATLEVVPAAGSSLPLGLLGDVIYIDTAPGTYLATSVLSLTPAGPNSVILSEIAAAVARTVGAAAGGLEVNNLLTGAGFERVLTTADLGGGVASLTGGININLTGTGVDPVVNLDAAITGVSVDGVTLNAVGPATNYLDESGNYSVPVGAGGGGSAGTISYLFDNNTGGTDPGATFFRTSTGNPASVTQFRFSDLDVDSVDVQNIIGNMVVGGYFILRKADDNTQYRVYAITSIVDNAGWYTINVNYLNTQSSGDNPIPNGAEILFEFFVSSMLAPTAAIGNQRPFAVWDASDTRYEGSGSLITCNPNSPPLGGRLQLGTTSGASITGPQILRPLGAADTYMDVVYGSDPNNAFYQSYFRVAGEMHFGANIASSITNLLTFDLSANVRIQSAAAFRIGEKAAAAADLAAYGQLYVDSADDSLHYQTEAGVNFDLTASSPVTQIVDGAANIAVIAEGLGLTGIRRVGNTDAEDCGIQFEYQNGTVRASIGNEFFTDVIYRNHIAGRHHIFRVGIGGGNRIRLHLDGDQTIGGCSLYAGSSATPRLQTLNHGVEVGNGTLFLVEQAAQEADIVGQGQLWVNSADDSLNYVTEAGVVFDLTNPPAGSLTPWVSDIDADGFNLDDLGVIYMRERSAAEVDVLTQGQIWVLDEGFSQSLMYTNDNGNDFELAALNLTFMNASALLVTGTGFVEAATFQPDINRDYMINAAFEVTAPSADDMKVEMVIDTNAVFKGVLTYSDQSGAITGTFALESGIGDVITNIVVVPTSGNATPDGTYITIVGGLNMGATSGTHSIRCGKNTDVGADGRVEGNRVLQASVLQVS